MVPDKTHCPAVDKVLITGAGGLLGRSAAAHFSHMDCNVTAVTRADLDIANQPAVLTLFDSIKPDVVINCAAATDVDRCERGPASRKGPLWSMSVPTMSSMARKTASIPRTISPIPKACMPDPSLPANWQ